MKLINKSELEDIRKSFFESKKKVLMLRSGLITSENQAKELTNNVVAKVVEDIFQLSDNLKITKEGENKQNEQIMKEITELNQDDQNIQVMINKCEKRITKCEKEIGTYVVDSEDGNK